MGQARRLGQAIFGCAGEGDFDCIFQHTFISHRDKDGFYVIAGSQNSADGILLVFEQTISAFLEQGVFEGTG